MKYGNCLTGALYLMWRYKTWKLRIITSGLFHMPHFYVIDRNGNKWHYRLEYDVLPYPLTFFVFRGKFARLFYTKYD